MTVSLLQMTFFTVSGLCVIKTTTVAKYFRCCKRFLRNSTFNGSSYLNLGYLWQDKKTFSALLKL